MTLVTSLVSAPGYTTASLECNKLSARAAIVTGRLTACARRPSRSRGCLGCREVARAEEQSAVWHGRR